MKTCTKVVCRHDAPTSAESRHRIVAHGEVFTPAPIVEAMLHLVHADAERVDARFLEPACGSGNFLVQVLRRKLATVELKFGGSTFARRHYSLLGLMCTYGIEILPDNIAECRSNMLRLFTIALELEPSDDLYRAAAYVLSQNLVHGDARTMLTSDMRPIIFAEWGYLGKGKFQRRDFRLEGLTHSAAWVEQAGSLFPATGQHEIFTPTRTYTPITLRGLARLFLSPDRGA